MPKHRRSRRPPPAGWELLEDTLEELGRKMRDAEVESDEGLRRCESKWPIFQIHRERSRYVFDMFREGKISKELLEWCKKQGYADGLLIAKWKKPGFENLCCLQCVSKSGTNFGTSCICRVPLHELDDPDKVIRCVNCGCTGCGAGRGRLEDESSGDESEDERISDIEVGIKREEGSDGDGDDVIHQSENE